MNAFAKELKAPFPWFGGKSRVAHIVWERFEGIKNYVEPFFGSGAVLLGRPCWKPGTTETVNDYDGFISNFWRAVAADPEAVAHWADWPVSENDLHARNFYLAKLREEFRQRIEGDPLYYDPMIAGWWVWGICSWIGSGFAELNGPWTSTEGLFLKGAGQGVRRQLPHLGDRGRGVHRKLPHLGNRGQGLKEYFQDLSERLRGVRVCCGDWKRVLGKTPTYVLGCTGIFLDPPYSHEERHTSCYTHDSSTIFAETAEWCLENGSNPLLKIALCGYEGEDGANLVSAGWEELPWKAQGGYAKLGDGNGQANAHKERIWFSPACVVDREEELI